MQFTQAQQRAIDETGANILVAAAAGSGKTAVLVERIIQKIVKRHCRVDELVVLTFTNAAAQEMRQRVRKRLDQLVHDSQGADKKYWQQQVHLLNQAKIATFHSFCIQILRQFYYATTLDPQFRIGDEFELALLRTQAMETTLIALYEQQNPQFLQFVDAYSGDRGDETIEGLIYQLANFQQSLVDVVEWEKRTVQNFIQTTDIFGTQWGQFLKQKLLKQLRQHIDQLEQAHMLVDQNAKNAPKVVIAIQECEKYVAQLYDAIAQENWANIRQILTRASFQRWPSGGSKDAKNIVDALKKDWKQWSEQYSIDESQVMQHQLFIGRQLATLFSATESYVNEYSRLKQQRNIVDFSDLERYTLALFQADEAIRTQFKASIHEVLVDEYQDTNEVQEAIITYCSTGSNTFMVGDVKQSIYRFRSADPQLFQMKYQTYENIETDGMRIDLNQNFRSRTQVLDFINHLFVQLMDQSFAEITYDDAAQLYAGASYPTHEHMQVEVHLLAPESETIQPVENQAGYIVEKIQSLVEKEFLVTDKGVSRPIRYADIAVLFRSRTVLFEQVSELLKAKQIPYVAQEQGSYFDASEIRNLLAILRIIDNPFDDIEYAGWLRSPIIGCNENDLLVLRLLNTHQALCQNVQQATESQVDELLYHKIQLVQAYEQRWHERVKQQPLAQWIEEMLMETGYYDFVGGLPNGIHRQANIDAFIDKARTYEAIGFRSLFKFNRFIVNMQEQKQDFTNSRSIAEQENVVQLMTIHKSKGLEFPVVFVVDLQKQFNMRDVSQTLVLDKTYGASLHYVDLEQNYRAKSLIHTVIGERSKQAQLAEELRILYVALTRAKEKLILVGQTKETIEQLQEKYSDVLDEKTLVLSEMKRTSAKSYLEWIMLSMIRHQSFAAFQTHPCLASVQVTQTPVSMHVQYHTESFLSESIVVEGVHDISQAIVEQSLLPNVQFDQVGRALGFVYPYAQATTHYAQVSISDLKRFELQQQTSEHYSLVHVNQTESLKKEPLMLPKFMCERTESKALAKGNAYHRVMQCLPQIVMTQCELQQWLVAILPKDEMRELIDEKVIQQFYASSLGEQFLEAESIQRELAFSLLRSSEEIFPYWQEKSEYVVMRGIFDAIYHLKDEIVIVDYKSDYISDFSQANQEKLWERYRIQMETYIRAAQRLFGSHGKSIRGELYFLQAQQSIHFS